MRLIDTELTKGRFTLFGTAAPVAGMQAGDNVGKEITSYLLDIAREFGAFGLVCIVLGAIIWWLLQDRKRQFAVWTQLINDRDKRIQELTAKCFELSGTLGEMGAKYREATQKHIEFLRGTKK